MIIDKIENSYLYYGVSPEIKACLKFIEANNFPSEIPSKVPVTDNVTFGISQYTTKELFQREWEAHEHCIDVQYVIKGTETISYANRDHMKYTGFQEGKDHLCYEGEGTTLTLSEGYFCILFTDDVHRTKTIAKSPCQITKGVFKIKL